MFKLLQGSNEAQLNVYKCPALKCLDHDTHDVFYAFQVSMPLTLDSNHLSIGDYLVVSVDDKENHFAKGITGFCTRDYFDTHCEVIY